MVPEMSNIKPRARIVELLLVEKRKVNFERKELRLIYYS